MSSSILLNELLPLPDLERRQRIEALGNSNPGNEEVIAALLALLQRDEDEITNWFLLRALEKIASGHDPTIQGLLQILQRGRPPSRIIAAEVLPTIAQGHEATIRFLTEALASSPDEQFCQAAALVLGKIAIGNALVSQALINLIYNCSDGRTRSLAASSLYEIDPGNQPALDAWLHLLRTGGDYYIRYPVVQYLAEKAVGNAEVISALKQIMKTPGEDPWASDTRKIAAMALKEVNRSPEIPNPFHRTSRTGISMQEFKAAQTEFYTSIHRDTIDEFLELLKIGGDDEKQFVAANLASFSIGDDRVFDALITLLEESQNASLRLGIINDLRKITPGVSEENKQAGIQVITQQMQTSQRPREKAQLAGLLGSLGGANQATADLLEQMINQAPPPLNPERLQEATQRLQAAGLSEEQISGALASMAVQSISHDRSAAFYNLGLLKGEVDGMEVLLAKLRTTTSSEELATIFVSLRKRAKERPEVFEALGEIVRTAVEPELYGMAIWGFIDLGGDNPEVISRLNDILAARSDYFEALLVRGSIYAQQRHVPQALEDCDRAMSLKPESIDPWVLRGHILFEQERYAEAIAVNQQILQLQPEDWSAWYNIACCYARQKQSQPAIAALARAMAIAPADVRSAAATDRDLDNLATLAEFQNLLNDA